MLPLSIAIVHGAWHLSNNRDLSQSVTQHTGHSFLLVEPNLNYHSAEQRRAYWIKFISSVYTRPNEDRGMTINCWLSPSRSTIGWETKHSYFTWPQVLLESTHRRDGFMSN